MAQRDLATDESASKSLDANAEFVPFRIGHHLPSRAAGERSPLGEGARSEGRKARDLMIEVRDKKIEMDAVLRLLRLWHALEIDDRQIGTPRQEKEIDPIEVEIADFVTERGGPERSESFRVAAVDSNLDSGMQWRPIRCRRDKVFDRRVPPWSKRPRSSVDRAAAF